MNLFGNKKLPGEAVLTTVFFNHEYQLVHNGKDIKKIEKITRKDYAAGGNTALLDALGKTIHNIGLKLHNIPEENRPGKVIFFIITDGQENSSKEFSQKKIREMIELQKNAYSWEFIFMGANIDAFSTADAIGINQNKAFNYTARHIGKAHKAMNAAVANFRKQGDVDKGEDFGKEIE
jgi:uncharacterized protein YegL